MPYLYCDENGRNWAVKTANGVTEVASSSTRWDAGWYVVNGSVTISTRIEVSGEVYLILADSGRLTASQGIHVPAGASLTIWGQQETYTEPLSGEDYQLIANGVTNKAGIGGDLESGGHGPITINGGTINAAGGTYGAGIGAGGGKLLMGNSLKYSDLPL